MRTAAALLLAAAGILCLRFAPGSSAAATGGAGARVRSAAASPARPRAATAARRGDFLYNRFCLPCHGVAGDGHGPAAPWLWPRPRDFTRGEFKWRTTASGSPPTDADLARTIRYGVPGTSMHAFGQTLSAADIRALVAKVKSFAPRAFARRIRPVPPILGRGTTHVTPRGAKLYMKLGCAQCHGKRGRGDGPSAASLRDGAGFPDPPYDLTTRPLRRPRAPGASGERAIYTSLVTGLSGTPMPSYRGAAPTGDLLAVAAYVNSLRAPDRPAPENGSSVVPALARKLDRGNTRVGAGFWPGRGAPVEARLFGGRIGLQGNPPPSLAPAEASVNERRCARCHHKQARRWRYTIHGAAGSPGLISQLIELEASGEHAQVASCQRCHAPLAEQRPSIRPPGAASWQPNPHFDPALRRQGISCAGCHLRGWRRYGPPLSPASQLLPLPGYPHTQLKLYQRADFCMPCHQLGPSSGIDGKPLLNTYVEWLQGPYMRRGIQCQHCHMPNREHTWKGIHDPDTFRQGIALTASATRSSRRGAVTVRANLKNAGAGHYLPTTPTPAVWLTIDLVDARGRRIRGAHRQLRIGRDLVFEHGFRQIADTRIPPGQSVSLVGAWKGGRTDEATAALVVVRVEPDEYYERFYKARLRDKHTPRVTALYKKALARAERSHYVAVERVIPIEAARLPTR